MRTVQPGTAGRSREAVGDADRVAAPWTAERLRCALGAVAWALARSRSVCEARLRLNEYVTARQFAATRDSARNVAYYVARDCARALRGMFNDRAEQLAGFSVADALRRIAQGRPPPHLEAGFYADLTHMFGGLHGRAQFTTHLMESHLDENAGAAIAIARSDELDRLWREAEAHLRRYVCGLDPEAQARRRSRRERIRRHLGGTPRDWSDWRWQCSHILMKPEDVEAVIPLSECEQAAVRAAWQARVPFGITPYYASLLDDETDGRRDRALRAQVLPPPRYVECMAAARDERACRFDFMREHDTSPVPLITRRYPAIVIIKPFHTCPQICVYCQRNWEIERPMAPHALASPGEIIAALRWIRAHPAIREVLVTGGDPLAMDDEPLLELLRQIADIPHVDLIRIGTRALVTIPMRITAPLARALGRLRVPGRRELVVVTHVEHPYEIAPDLVRAVGRLRRQGIAVYNQLVYTFYVSRRFEAAALRLWLRRVGIDPYYTFAPKGKEETRDYRVPLARILQEQKEEARLLPGMRRTDEAVINLPGLGKNNLRALQHRDLLSVLPDGSRVYEFHPWEKNIVRRESYVGIDVPILDYLQRLAAIGEDPAAYDSIWYYF